MRTSTLASVVLAATTALGACASTADDGGTASAAAETAAPNACTNAKMIAMIDAPISPNNAAGLNFANLTIDAAAAQICTPTPAGEVEDGSGNASVEAGWAKGVDTSIVMVEYAKATKVIEFVQLNPGYRGVLEFKSRPTSLTDPTQPNPFGVHTYRIGVAVAIERDGAPMTFDWTDAKMATELYDAMMFTFAPTASSTQDNCVSTAACLFQSDESGHSFGARSLGLYLHAPTDSATESSSFPDYLYAFPR